MPNLNRCEFMGHLGRDVEQRFMASGDPVVNASMGVTTKWKDKSGEQKERTEWVRIVAYGYAAKALADGKKGQPWYICGEMQTREWSDKDNVKKYTTEINARDAYQLLTAPKDAPKPAAKPAKSGIEDMSDDLPWKG